VFAAENMQLGLVSKGQDFLIYLPFFAFGMAYRAYRNGDPYALWVLALAFMVSAYNAAENASGISMDLSVDNFFGYALCHVIFVILMVVFKNGSSPLISYFGVLSYPLYLVHQDIGLIGIELLRPLIGQFAAAVLLVFMAVAAAAAVQSIVVRLTAMLRRE
jgi:peptidoglycan/LPS O-acetylase OafA/YrhL